VLESLLAVEEEKLAGLIDGFNAICMVDLRFILVLSEIVLVVVDLFALVARTALSGSHTFSSSYNNSHEPSE
jgi:hypothetical protein